MATTTSPPTDIAGYNPTTDADGYWYDPETAESNVDFYADCLVYLDGKRAGEPFQLEPWQKDIIRTIYGWKDQAGLRRYRTVFWFIPRKNGKTTIAAGMAKQAMYADGEPRARCYCTAESKEQAELLYDMVRDQVLQNTDFAALSKIRDSRKRILHKDRLFTALAVGDSAGHGLNVSFCAYDEFHLFRGEKHKEMYNSMHTATGNRPQPLELIITTAGWDRQSMCYEQYQIAKQIRDGTTSDPTFLPIIFEAAENDDWTDPAVWRKANPNMGVTISEEYIKRECERAQREVGYENVFKRLHLNMWTSQESRWIPMERWRGAPQTDRDIAAGAKVWGGLDLSSTIDITAWVLCEKVGAGYRLRGHYFIPADTMRQAEARDKVPYSKWVKAGYITAISGARIDYDYVTQRILADSTRYNLQSIGYDPWNAHAVQKYLAEDKGLEMFKVRQGYGSLSSPSKLFEACVLSGQIDHGNDPVLDWMCDNVMLKTDENANIRPVKPHHSSSKKVDGVLAAIMAIFAEQVSEAEARSAYETPGMLVL